MTIQLKVDENKFKPELIYDGQDVKVYKYMIPHFAYFNAYNRLVRISRKRSTIRNKGWWSENCRRSCDYLYRICTTKEDTDVNFMKKLKASTGLSFNKMQYEEVAEYTGDYHNYVLFTNSSAFIENMKKDLVFFDLLAYREDNTQTIQEIEKQRLKDRDNLLKTLFYNQTKAIAEKYGLDIYTFINGEVKFKNAYVSNKTICQVIQQALKDTIVKDLEQLGFKVKFNPYIDAATVIDRLIESIKFDDNILKENGNESKDTENNA